jgi:hypothetical protein
MNWSLRQSTETIKTREQYREVRNREDVPADVLSIEKTDEECLQMKRYGRFGSECKARQGNRKCTGESRFGDRCVYKHEIEECKEPRRQRWKGRNHQIQGVSVWNL